MQPLVQPILQLPFDLFIWCGFQIFVFLKLASNVFVQGAARAKTGILGYPEDRKGNQRVAVANPTNAADLPLARANNLFRNDLENLIPFSLLTLAASFVQIDPRILICLLVVYAVCRVVHSVCLMTERQPYRTGAYLAGQLCALAVLVLMVIRLIPFYQT